MTGCLFHLKRSGMCDRAVTLEGELHEGEGVCYVALQDMDALPEKVKDLLQKFLEE